MAMVSWITSQVRVCVSKIRQAFQKQTGRSRRPRIKRAKNLTKGDVIYYVKDGYISICEVLSLEKFPFDKDWIVVNVNWYLSQHQFDNKLALKLPKKALVDIRSSFDGAFVTMDSDKAFADLEKQINKQPS